MYLQDVPVSPCQSFYAGSFENPDFNFAYSFHPEIEILLIRSGTCLIVIGDKPVRIRSGDVVVIGPHVPHFLQNLHGESQGPHWAKSTVIIFRPDFLGDVFWSSSEMAGLRGFFDRMGNSGTLLRGRAVKPLADIIEQIPEKRGLVGLARLLDVFTLINALPKSSMIRLEESLETQPLHQQDMRRLNRVFEFLRINLDKEIRLRDVAQLISMTPTSFSRFFHNKTGKTFQRCLLETRLNEAAVRLLSSRQNVSEICFSCGFGNLSSFNRQFRLRHGVTPTEYRTRWIANVTHGRN